MRMLSEALQELFEHVKDWFRPNPVRLDINPLIVDSAAVVTYNNDIDEKDYPFRKGDLITIWQYGYNDTPEEFVKALVIEDPKPRIIHYSVDVKYDQADRLLSDNIAEWEVNILTEDGKFINQNWSTELLSLHLIDVSKR